MSSAACCLAFPCQSASCLYVASTPLAAPRYLELLPVLDYSWYIATSVFNGNNVVG